MEIIRAQPSDADELTALAHAAKRSWGYPESWIESWRQQLTVTPAFIRDHETYGCRVEGRFVGFYALAGGGAKMEIAHLWVLPAWQGKGIGRLLFEHAIGRLRGLGISVLEIESDPNAEGFYAHLGARRVGVNRYPMGDGVRELPLLRYPLNP